MMGECGKCGLEIMVSDNPLACGICSMVLHQRCTDLKKPVAKMVVDYDNLMFKCDKCLSGQSSAALNGDLDVSELMREMGKLTSLSDSITGIQSSIEAQISKTLQKEIAELKKSFNDVLRSNLASIESSVAKKLENFEKSLIEINRKRTIRDVSIHSESDALPNKRIKSLAGKEQKPITDNDTDDEVFDSGKIATYARVLSGKAKKQKIIPRKKSQKEGKARSVIVIKPVESTKTSEETRTFLKQKLDPKIHKIGNFRNGKDGSIIVECATGDNIESVKNSIESNLGAGFNAVIPTPAKPKLKIVGMSDHYSSEDFVDLLKSQNGNIKINEVKVIADFENPRFKYNKYNVIIEVDKDTYCSLMSAGKVSIGWDKCTVYEAFNVLRCFNCGEFGHKSTECKNEQMCSKCNGNHKTSECTSTDYKCVNCIKTNQERNMNLDVSHPAFSGQCPVFQRLVERKKQQLWSGK